MLHGLGHSIYGNKNLEKSSRILIKEAAQLEAILVQLYQKSFKQVFIK
jgi:hypothetical protein